MSSTSNLSWAPIGRCNSCCCRETCCLCLSASDRCVILTSTLLDKLGDYFTTCHGQHAFPACHVSVAAGNMQCRALQGAKNSELYPPLLEGLPMWHLQKRAVVASSSSCWLGHPPAHLLLYRLPTMYVDVCCRDRRHKCLLWRDKTCLARI